MDEWRSTERAKSCTQGENWDAENSKHRLRAILLNVGGKRKLLEHSTRGPSGHRFSITEVVSSGLSRRFNRFPQGASPLEGLFLKDGYFKRLQDLLRGMLNIGRLFSLLHRDHSRKDLFCLDRFYHLLISTDASVTKSDDAPGVARNIVFMRY